MVAFLKHRGAEARSAQKEVTNFINAARYSIDSEGEPFDGVKSSIANFRKRNPQMARQIDADPLKYVQLETGLK
jgi:hypothetical protein